MFRQKLSINISQKNNDCGKTYLTQQFNLNERCIDNDNPRNYSDLEAKRIVPRREDP